MQNQTSSGIGFFGLLAIIFIVLKLVGTITWSWWWVLAPLWAPWLLALVIILAVVSISYIADLIKK